MAKKRHHGMRASHEDARPSTVHSRAYGRDNKYPLHHGDEQNERMGRMNPNMASAKSHEAYEGAMIHEDHSAPCLLPRMVMEKAYGYGAEYNMHHMEDLYSGVQIQLHEDGEGAKKAFRPGKY